MLRARRTDVVFDVHLIGGHFASQESRELPPAVQRTVDGMRDTFPYASYGLLETFTLRASPGGDDSVVGGFIDGEGAMRVDYRFRAEIAEHGVRQDAIELRRIRLQLYVVGDQIGREESEISTKLTTQAGKTIVVGKAGIRGVADGVFLVLTTRLD